MIAEQFGVGGPGYSSAVSKGFTLEGVSTVVMLRL